jgi:hypothetical protein
MDNEFLDMDMNDCAIENISEDQQSDESEGSEASEFEIAQDEVEQSDLIQRRCRKGPKPKKNGNWTSENLKIALNNIDDGMSIHLAVKLERIPTSSVRNHYSGKTRG